MAVPCHEPTENQRRYREKERKNHANRVLEPARLGKNGDNLNCAILAWWRVF
jgi:hypothetical protein